MIWTARVLLTVFVESHEETAMKINNMIIGAGTVGALLCSACASATVPARETINARASIQAAEELHAEEQPQASFYLALAREEAVKADQYAAADDVEAARRYLRRSQADADLAVALAQQARAEADATEAQTHINDLRREHL